MVRRNFRNARKRGNPSVHSRDADGTDHLLRVTEHPAGMVSISDDEMVRILSPSETAALVLELVHVMGGVPAGAAGGGPISGSF